MFSVLNSFASEPIPPLIPNVNLDQQKFELGELLFKETRLSVNKKVSCHTCHDLASGGDDGLKTPTGLGFNSPTIFNASKNFYIGWRGKFSRLKPHLDFIMSNPKVMGTDWPNAIQAIKRDSIYTQPFRASYQGNISQDNILDAILYYESNLIVPAKFDAYLQGQDDAISAAAKLGYKVFKNYGCISCHQGTNVGGNLFQQLGIIKPYQGQDGKYQTQKLRVPSLRNVALTAPYLHDGSIESLESIITIMAEYQLGQTLTHLEVRLIKAFLESLNSVTEQVANEKN